MEHFCLEEKSVDAVNCSITTIRCSCSVAAAPCAWLLKKTRRQASAHSPSQTSMSSAPPSRERRATQTLFKRRRKCLNKQGDVMCFVRQCRLDLVFLQEMNFYSTEDVKQLKEAFKVPAYFSLAPSQAQGVRVVALNLSLRFTGVSSIAGC